MSKISLNQTNTLEKSREQLGLSGTLNFYTQQHADHSPKNGIQLNQTHDLTASLLSGGNCNSSNNLRRGELSLANPQKAVSPGYIPQTQTH